MPLTNFHLNPIPLLIMKMLKKNYCVCEKLEQRIDLPEASIILKRTLLKKKKPFNIQVG